MLATQTNLFQWQDLVYAGVSVVQLPSASPLFFPSFWLALLSLPAVPILSGNLLAVDAPVTRAAQ